MEIAILSDTHIPDQAQAIPEEFEQTIRTADHVLHGGDFGSLDAIAEMEELAPALTAVYGNADPNDSALPAVASVDLGGVTFVVVHGVVNVVERAVFSSEGVVTSRGDWSDAVADVTRYRAEEPMVGVGGHSHDVEDTEHEGVRLLNPGSATGVGRAEAATMMTAEVADGNVTVSVHEL